MTPQEIAVNRVQIATDRAWAYTSRNIYIRWLLGLPGDGVFFRATPEEASERAGMLREIRASLDGIDAKLLPHDLALTARILRGSDIEASADGERYWLVDLVAGFPGPFSITPYKLGLLFSALGQIFPNYKLDSEGDADRYLALLADVATLAGEAGMFDDPYDRYGRLLMDAMLPALGHRHRHERAALAAGKSATIHARQYDDVGNRNPDREHSLLRYSGAGAGLQARR